MSLAFGNSLVRLEATGGITRTEPLVVGGRNMANGNGSGEMLQNQRVKFTAEGTEAEIQVSLHQGKKDYTVAARTFIPDGDKVKKQKGCVSYHEKTADGAKEAQAAFEKLVADTEKAGWKKSEKVAGPSRRAAFSEIPPPPPAKAKPGPTLKKH